MITIRRSAVTNQLLNHLSMPLSGLLRPSPPDSRPFPRASDGSPTALVNASTLKHPRRCELHRPHHPTPEISLREAGRALALARRVRAGAGIGSPAACLNGGCGRLLRYTVVC